MKKPQIQQNQKIASQEKTMKTLLKTKKKLKEDWKRKDIIKNNKP